jgi:glycosyltransferase involved in cell wall biosynthesis
MDRDFRFKANPLVSIIIPVYNAEKYLAECITSAIGQTWQNTEIIIIDDGSTDDSLKIAQNYSDNRNIKIITQINKGASSARNAGLKEAKGDYIQFLDADDLLSPDKIYQQVIHLEQNPGKVAICSTVHFYTGTSHQNSRPSLYEESFLFSDDDPIHFLINLLGGYSKNGAMISIHSWLTPKNIIDKAGLWNEELSIDDDGEFFSRVLLRSKGVIKSGGLSFYRKYTSTTNLSASKNIIGAISRVKAATLKKDQLLTINNSIEAQMAIYKSFINIAADYYLLYPLIYKEAISALPNIKFTFKPSSGGNISNKLASILGWRLVKRLKKMFKS